MSPDQMLLFGGVLGLSLLGQYILAGLWLFVFFLGVVDDDHKPYALLLFFAVTIWRKFYKVSK